MSYRVSITPTGQRSVDALRGKARKSFDAAVKRLAAEGCVAGDYRLTGEGIEHICAIHLYGRHRALVAFPDEASVVVLLVGEHLANDPELDVWTTPLPTYLRLKHRGAGRQPLRGRARSALDARLLGAIAVSRSAARRRSVVSLAVVNDEGLLETVSLIEAMRVDVADGGRDRHLADPALSEPRPCRIEQLRSEP